MGDYNTRLKELHKEIDTLKGCMEGVVESVLELSKMVDAKVASAMNDVKKLIRTMIAGNNQVANGAREVSNEVGDQACGGMGAENSRENAREEGYELPSRNHRMEFLKFDGIGLQEWIYRGEHFFLCR